MPLDSTICHCDLRAAIVHQWDDPECLEILPVDQWFNEQQTGKPDRTRAFVKEFNHQGAGCNEVGDWFDGIARVEMDYCGQRKSEAKKIADAVYDILNRTQRVATECYVICDLQLERPMPRKMEPGWWKINTQITMKLGRNIPVS